MQLAKKIAVVAALVLALGSGPVLANEEQDRVDQARITVNSFAADENMELMLELLNKAHGVVIIPQLLKAGFIIGGSGGSGVLLSYDPESKSWSSPSFLTMGSGSVGLQIGAESAEIMLLIMSKKGMEAVVKNKFTLGGDASVAVGPLGAGAKAATTTNIGADIYSFSKAKGLFGGIALEGAVLQPNESANKAYYGSAVTPIDIVVERKVSNPGALPLEQSLVEAQVKGAANKAQ